MMSDLIKQGRQFSFLKKAKQRKERYLDDDDADDDADDDDDDDADDDVCGAAGCQALVALTAPYFLE